MSHTIESLGFNATLDELLTLIDPRIAEAVYAHHAELEAQRDGFEEESGELESDLREANWELEKLQDKFDTLENELETLQYNFDTLKNELETK